MARTFNKYGILNSTFDVEKLVRPSFAVNYAAACCATIEAVRRESAFEAVVSQRRRDRHQHDAEIASWKHLRSNRCPQAVIVDIEDRQIGGLRVHRQHGIRRDVPRIYIGALSPDEVADHVAASYRYAKTVGMDLEDVAAGFRRLWSNLRGDTWAIRQRIGPEQPPFDYACRPWWARRLRFALFGIGRWDAVAPSNAIAEVLARLLGLPAAALLLSDDDFDAYDFMRWVRQGWRPGPGLIRSIGEGQRQARTSRLKAAGPLASSPLRRQADALWLAVYFQRDGEGFAPRNAPATRADLRGLV